jgi:hypothetical protein
MSNAIKHWQMKHDTVKPEYVECLFVMFYKVCECRETVSNYAYISEIHPSNLDQEICLQR